MQLCLMVLLLTSSNLQVEARPLDIFAIVGDTGSAIFDGIRGMAESGIGIATNSLIQVQKVGSGVRDLTEDLVSTVGDSAVYVNDAFTGLIVGGLGGVRDMYDAATDFYGQSMASTGKLGTGLIKTSLGTAKAVGNATHRFIQDSLSRTMNNMESAVLAAGKFSTDTMDNTLGLIKDTGAVATKFANATLEALTG